MKTEENKQTILEFTRIFKNDHNIDGVDHLFAPNFRHNFKTKIAPGFEGFKEVGRRTINAFPDVVAVEKDLIACDDKVVARSFAKGTHKGKFMGIEPTNKPVTWSEIHIYRFDDSGKIAEHWVELSMFELISQLNGKSEAFS